MITFIINIYLLTWCLHSLPLPFLLPCVALASQDDAAAVLLLGIAAELVVGELQVVIAVTVVALFTITLAIDRSWALFPSPAINILQSTSCNQHLAINILQSAVQNFYNTYNTPSSWVHPSTYVCLRLLIYYPADQSRPSFSCCSPKHCCGL